MFNVFDVLCYVAILFLGSAAFCFIALGISALRSE